MFENTNRLAHAIYDELTDIINEKHLEFFVGGSVRFGYNDITSDYDIFIKSESHDTGLIFTRLGFKKVNRERDHSEYPIEMDLYDFNNIIHIGIMKDTHYKALEREHNIIENFIRDNHHMLSVCMFLKPRISGANIYRMLLTAARNQ